MMKKMLYAVLAALFILVSCKDKPEPEKLVDISGDWQISKVEVKSVTIGSVDVDVYLRFTTGGGFELYQMLGSGRYRVFTGSWKLEEDVLSGTYSDGKAWGSAYKLEKPDDNTLRLTSVSTNPEVDTYTRTTIPQTVIDTAE